MVCSPKLQRAVTRVKNYKSLSVTKLLSCPCRWRGGQCCIDVWPHSHADRHLSRIAQHVRRHVNYCITRRSQRRLCFVKRCGSRTLFEFYVWSVAVERVAGLLFKLPVLCSNSHLELELVAKPGIHSEICSEINISFCWYFDTNVTKSMEGNIP